VVLLLVREPVTVQETASVRARHIGIAVLFIGDRRDFTRMLARRPG
jgi:hypothetical protein